MAYSKKVVDKFENTLKNPEKFNVGRFDPKDGDVGTGMVGAPACGDVMKLQIKCKQEGNQHIIEDVKFKTYGCGSAIASSAELVEMLIGKTLDEAKERNLKLLQQTHWGTLAETLDETVKLIKTVNRQNFGITFEPANLMACGSDFNKNALSQLLPFTENFYFQNIILDKKGKHLFPTIHKGDVRVKYVSLDNSKGINVFSFLDFLREKNYDKWFTVHQPLLEDQTVESAIENASKLFLEYKF